MKLLLTFVEYSAIMSLSIKKGAISNGKTERGIKIQNHTAYC